MKLLQFSMLASMVRAQKNESMVPCHEKNEEIRKANEEIRISSILTFTGCKEKKAGSHWSKLNEETKTKMLMYLEQQKENAKADRKFCSDIRKVYGPFSFKKPASLECEYYTDRSLKNCGDAEKYDEKCERSYVISLPPQDEHDGKRVPNVIVLGETGSGKSYFCNGLMGYENPSDAVFGVGHNSVSCTRKPRGIHGRFYNDLLINHGIESMAINLYDTPGFADSDKCQIEANKQRIAEKFDKPIDMFGYLLNAQNPRINANQQLIFKNLNEWTMGNIWSKLVIIYGRSVFDNRNRNERFNDKKSYYQELEKKILDIKETLWTMAQDGNWKKTFLNSQSNEVISRPLAREDFNNIRYSALNVNQNRHCSFIFQKNAVSENDEHCWRMANLTSSLDYEADPSYNPFGSENPFVVHDDKWILIEEAKRFQNILKENMKHPVSPAKEFWRKKYEKDLQEYNSRIEASKTSLDEPLQTAGVDYSSCQKVYDNDLLALKEYSACPKWGPWNSGKCDATCGHANRRLTRECFRGDLSVDINDCRDEFPNDSSEYKYEPCINLPECKMGPWENVGSCSKSCGEGLQTQTRVCDGNYCGSQPSTQTIPCMTEKCLKWGPWNTGECNATCGHANRKLTRECYRGDSSVDIHECKAEFRSDSHEYKYEPCINLPECKMGPWYNVGSCTKSCGVGKQYQTRMCDGNYCGSQPSTRIIPCMTEKCPKWGPWDNGECNATCGRAKKKFTRECFRGDLSVDINECKAKFHYDSSEYKYEPCIDLPECKMGPWKNLGSCSKSCGEGLQYQTRVCDGNYCGSQLSTRTIPCMTEKCSKWDLRKNGACQEKNKEIRKDNDHLKNIANKALEECHQKIIRERWTKFASETQKNLSAYVDKQAKNAGADQKFCDEMKRVYGPLNFEKPASLDCVYDTDLNRRNCRDANEYDSTCETGAEVKRLEPKDEVNGQRVPNIVILGMTGSGKSYFCNGLLGYQNPDKGVFGTGALSTSCTRKPVGSHALFYNDVLVAHGVESMAINLFDTPGFADSDKCQIEANKQRIVEKFDKPIDVFGYLMKPNNPRIDYNQQVIFKNLNEWTLGNIWSNLVIIYGRTKFSSEARNQRYSDKRSYKRDLEEKIHSIREALWKMAQEGEWKKTYLDSLTNEVTSRLLNKEDFNNIQYSALNVNQNKMCPSIMEGKGANKNDRYCAKKAKFTSPPSFDYEPEVMNFDTNMNDHEFLSRMINGF